MWALQATEWHKELAGHSGQVLALCVSSEGDVLASGSDEGTVRLWHLPDGEPMKELKGRHIGGVTSIAMSMDGKTLATGSWDRTVRLWRLPDGEPLATLEGHNKVVRTLAISPDGRTLASGSADHVARLWDLRPARLPYLAAAAGAERSAEDRVWMGERLADETLHEGERQWLEFMAALMRVRADSMTNEHE